MNIFKLFYRRKLARSIPFFLLTAITVGFLSMTICAFLSAEDNINSMEGGYTTLAVPLSWNYEDARSLLGVPVRYFDNGDILMIDSGKMIYGKQSVAATAAKAPQTLKVENSGLLSAALLNADGLSSGTIDVEQYHQIFDLYSYNFCVLALKCLSVTEEEGEEDLLMIKDENGQSTLETYTELGYTAEFEVLGALSLKEAYGSLESDPIYIRYNTMFSYSNVPYTEQGTCPFEPGKQYLIRGFYFDYGFYQQRSFDKAGHEHRFRGPLPANERYETDVRVLICAESNDNTGLQPVGKHISPKDLSLVRYRDDDEKLTYYAPPEGSLPFYAEYTGDWQDYLERDEGRVWKEQIIPWTEMNQNSAAVVLTDNLDSSYNFNTGIADILEGRRFTEQEYESGSSVCLVSAAFAEYNNLSVGDSLELDYYDTGVLRVMMSNLSRISNQQNDFRYVRYPLQPENRIDVQKTYEIVGIYTAPEFEPGQYNFTADTIFVPKNSVPNAEAYEEPDVAYLNALILKNGSEEAFEAYLASKGMGGNYVYENMQYHRTIPALKAVADNALRLLAVGLAVFAVAAAVVFSLTTRWLTPSVLAARRLGIAKQTLRRQEIGANAVFFALAAAAGAAAGGLLYQTLTGLILKTDVEFHLLPLILSAAAELLVLMAVSCMVALKTTDRSLMQTRK